MARTPAARHRRRRRFTPRRWLPFVLLSALVVGATVIEPDSPSVTPEQLDPSLDLTIIPTVAAADAISTAWHCGGGSALGEEGIAEMTIVLANDAATGAVAEVTVLGAEGPEATEQVEVPAYGRARVAVADLLAADWAAATVEVRGGRVSVEREVTGPLGFDSSPCASRASDQWYVPSGATERGAELYLSIANPFPDGASVDITLATDTGRRRPRALRSLSIPGGAVRVVRIGEVVTNRTEIAAEIDAKVGQVVVDRIQTYDGTGEPLTDALGEDGPVAADVPRGLVSTLAVPVRSDRWVFPGARIAPSVRTRIAIYNPSSEAAEVDVVTTYQDPERVPGVEPVALTIRPRQQVVVDLADIADLVPEADLWIDVRSLDGVPVVAERLSYYGPDAPRRGAAATVGSPVASTSWLVAQGGPTRLRSTTVQVANPGAADAVVRVEQLVDGDRSPLEEATITVPAGDRRSLDLAGAGAAASLVITSDEPVVVASSISISAGEGIALQPGVAHPEGVVALPPLR